VTSRRSPVASIRTVRPIVSVRARASASVAGRSRTGAAARSTIEPDEERQEQLVAVDDDAGRLFERGGTLADRRSVVAGLASSHPGGNAS